MNLSHILIFIALVSYAASSVLFLGSVKGREFNSLYQKYAMVPFLIATNCLTLSLIGILFYGYYSQTSSLVLVAVISWLTLIGHYFFNMRLMGVFVAPFSIFILLFQLFTHQTNLHLSSQPPDYFALTHIVLSIIGEAFAVCACAVALLLLRHQNLLKRKKIVLIPKGSPPLEKLDKYLFLSIWFGFSFLTLGLITGAIYAGIFGYKESLLSSKVLWALIVWTWYLVILIARNIIGWSSKRISKMSLIGFFMILISVLGFISLGDSI